MMLTKYMYSKTPLEGALFRVCTPILRQITGCPFEFYCMHTFFLYMYSQIRTDCVGSRGLLTLQPGATISVLHLTEGKETTLSQATKSFSLQTLLSLGLTHSRVPAKCKSFGELPQKPKWQIVININI